jgi:hypothetical protein
MLAAAPRCRAEQRADKLCLDSHVSITTLVQPLPSWFPLSTVPQPPAAWRTPDARGRRCRPSPPRRSGQACEDKTPERVVPSTFPRHRWSRLLLPFPLPASLPTAVSMCARAQPRSMRPCAVLGQSLHFALPRVRVRWRRLPLRPMPRTAALLPVKQKRQERRVVCPSRAADTASARRAALALLPCCAHACAHPVSALACTAPLC